MILNILLPILVIWIFGYYDGVQCAVTANPIDLKNLDAFEKHRQNDIFKYLNYGIEDFDAYNHHCYLAFLVYLSKYMFDDENRLKKADNLSALDDFSQNIFRVLSTEFRNKFYDKTSRLHDQIHKWYTSGQAVHVGTVVRETNEIIEFGLNKYIWKTEKEFKIIKIYRSETITKTEEEMILKAYKVCKSNYENLTKRTTLVGMCMSNRSRHQEHLLNYYNFVPSEPQDFGSLTLFITDDEYDALINDNDNQSRNLYIVEFLENVLIEIIRHINAVLQQMKDIINIPDMMKIDRDQSDMELLFILRHLYLQTTDATHDLYLLFRILSQKSKILKDYILFSVSFKKKWTTIFSQAKTSVESSEANKKTITSIQASYPVKNITSAQHLSQRRLINDTEAYDPTEDLETVDLKNVDQGLFSKRKPSFIGLYSVFNDSWNDPLPNESNLNEKKVILYDLNAMLTNMKHYIYSLTVAARSKQKKNPAWDCGFINGISAPQSGPLGYNVETYKCIKPDKLNASLMNELKSARKFIKEYRCPILQNTPAKKNE